MMRRFYIWIFSLAVILLIYLVINALSSREPMSIEKTSSEITADANSSQSKDQVGRLEDVAITELKKTVYMHRSQQGEVDREFGFREVIRSEGNFWEIDKPFINFFRRDFTCYVSSDKGNIETETVSGQPSPKAGSMKENVIIHIVPKQGAQIKESFIYLDDISFESERSQASTSGPVRFVSEEVELKGIGLVFVFNGEAERLEYLRIPKLEFLKIRTSSKVLMFGSEKENSAAQLFGSDNLASDVVTSDEKAAPAGRSNLQQILTEEADRLYRWVLNKNVVIDCPEQLILADQFFVNNIFLKKTGRQSPNSDIPAQEEFVPPWAKQVEHLGLYKVRGSAGPEGDLVDITIRCEGGILVTPMDSNINPEKVTAV